MLTRKQLGRFVRERLKSGLNSNLQFQSDADHVGIDLKRDFPDPVKFGIDGFTGYQWTFDDLEGERVRMVEFGNRLYLSDEQETNADAASMFERLNTAFFLPPPDTYADYPPADEEESGCKVGWRIYADREKAGMAASAAKHNAAIKAQDGYDFGYQAPGSIQPTKDGRYRVCVP